MAAALTLPHGELTLPVFLPDATRGVVRGLSSSQVAEVGIEGLVVSTAHLVVQPGASVIRKVGGINRFTGWPGPILSDSGGFQAFSLQAENGLGKVTDRGLHYRFSTGHKFRQLTPRSCIEAQVRLGSDVVYCLDLCTSPKAPRADQERSVELTIRWARQCREVFDSLTDGEDRDRPRLFAVVQGGPYRDLRARCAAELLDIGFDGYGFGGYPVIDGSLVDEVFELPGLVPDHPLHGLGIGTPENLVAAWRSGFDVFDCVLPTRNGRRGVLYAQPTIGGADDRSSTIVRMDDERWVREAGPVDPGCDCPVCTNLGAAYLAHLFRIEDRLAGTLGAMHNLRFYRRLIGLLRDQRSRN